MRIPPVTCADERSEVLGKHAALTPISQDHGDRGSPAELRRLRHVRHVEQRVDGGLPRRTGSLSVVGGSQHHAQAERGGGAFD